MLAAVAAVLGVREAPGTPVLELVAGALGRQQVLLVLDNCEHVLDAVARLCEGVLPVADDVRGVFGDHAHQVRQHPPGACLGIRSKVSARSRSDRPYRTGAATAPARPAAPQPNLRR